MFETRRELNVFAIGIYDHPIQGLIGANTHAFERVQSGLDQGQGDDHDLGLAVGPLPLELVRGRGARRESSAETSSKDTPHENWIENVVLAEHHYGVSTREQGTTEVCGVQLIPESMCERESSVFDVGLSETPACWSVDVDDLLRCAVLAVEYVREDGFFGDWNGRPGRGVDDHSCCN